MDENREIPEVSSELISRRCPVSVGDRFYRRRNGQKPDRILVMAIDPTNDGFLIHGKYLYHEGNKIRVFHSSIFQNQDWVIE